MEREKMKVFVMMCKKMSSVLTLTDDWAFIDDVYDDWTNGIMTRGTGLVTNSCGPICN
jgi:hypothetical protein